MGKTGSGGLVWEGKGKCGWGRRWGEPIKI